MHAANDDRRRAILWAFANGKAEAVHPDNYSIRGGLRTRGGKVVTPMSGHNAAVRILALSSQIARLEVERSVLHRHLNALTRRLQIDAWIDSALNPEPVDPTAPLKFELIAVPPIESPLEWLMTLLTDPYTMPKDALDIYADECEANGDDEIASFYRGVDSLEIERELEKLGVFPDSDGGAVWFADMHDPLDLTEYPVSWFLADTIEKLRSKDDEYLNAVAAWLESQSDTFPGYALAEADQE